MKHFRLCVLILSVIMLQHMAHGLNIVQAKAENREYGFIPNKGQWRSDVLWLGHLKNMNVWVTKTGVNFDYRVAERVTDKSASALSKQSDDKWKVEGHNVRMNIVAATGTAKAAITDASGSHNNYFFGNDESKWVTNVPVCSKATISEIQKGVDMVLSINNDGMPRYDFIVKPGTNPKNIELKFDGAKTLKVESGAVEYTTRFGTIKNAKLLAYQENGSGSRNQVNCDFSRKGNKVVFNLGEYDKSKPLVIDPTVFATYLGTSKSDEIRKMAIDPASGEVVVVGFTDSDQFPWTTGAYDSTYSGTDGFVTKFTKDLNKTAWSTYIGGGGTDKVNSVAIDANGNIYICGETNSPDYPHTGQFLQGAKGLTEAFFTKFSPGGKFSTSTVFGGSTDDRAFDVAVDNSGVAVVVGETFSNNFKLKNEDKTSKAEANRSDGFIVKFTLPATDVTFSTFFGSPENDRINAVAIDGSGVYITGECGGTLYKTYPTMPATPYDAAFNGGARDCFVAKMAPNGIYNNPQAHFITYIGGTTASGIGNGDDVGKAITVLANGEILVVGETTGNLFPTGVGTPKGAVDIFVLKLQQNGRQFVGGQYVGGNQNDVINSLAYSKETSQVWIVGNTLSSNFPTKPGVQAEQTKLMGGQDGFVYRFDVGSFDSEFSRFMGGNRTDDVTGVAVTPRGDAYFCGTTESTGLFSFRDSYQRNSKGLKEGFVRKHAFGTVSLDFPNGGPVDIFCPGTFINVQFVKSAPLQTSDPLTIQLSSNNGTTWDTIGRKVVTSPWLWNIHESLLPGKYRIRVIHESGVRDESDTNFTIIPAPAITTRPVSDTVCPGDTTQFSVAATGDGITYQWYFGETKLDNQTGPVLILRNITPQQAGKYAVSIGSANCSPIRLEAMLVGRPATTVTQQPVGDTTVELNKAYMLTVKASGENLKYQWYFDDEPITTAESNSYEIKNVNKSVSGKYKVIVTGRCGTTTSREVLVKNKDTIPESVLDDGTSEAGTLKIAMLSSIPVTDQMNFTVVSQKHCPLHVNITDMMGSVVRNIYSGTLETLNVLPLNVQCADLPTGTYYISARCGTENAIMKVSIIK